MLPLSTPPRPPLQEYAALLVLSTVWGSSFTFTRIGLETIPPATLMALRVLIAGLTLAAIMLWRGQRLPCDGASLRLYGVQALVNSAIPFLLIAWGQQWVDAGLAVILNATTPIYVYVFTYAFTRHESLSARKLAGICAGLAGIALIVGFEAVANLGRNLLPELAIVLASVAYAISIICGRGFNGRDPILPSVGALLTASAILVPIALVMDHPWTLHPSTSSLLAMLGLAIGSTAIGNVLYYRLLATLGSLATSSQSYLRVPIGAFIAMLVLGERLSPSAAVGLVCVVAGVAAMTIPPRRLA